MAGRHSRRFRQYRAAFLALLGAGSVFYGIAIALVVGSHRDAPWLPGSGLISGLPRLTWAVIWVGAGVLEAGLCWLPAARRWLFGIGAAVAGGWAVAFIAHWVRRGGPGGWAPGATSALIAALILLASAWPDPPEG